MSRQVFLFFLFFTITAGVVHQDDLLEEDGRRGVQDTVHRPQQSAPGLIVEHDDHAGGRQGGASLERLLYTSAVTRVGGGGERAQRSDCALQFLGDAAVSLFHVQTLPPAGCPFHWRPRMCGRQPLKSLCSQRGSLTSSSPHCGTASAPWGHVSCSCTHNFCI